MADNLGTADLISIGRVRVVGGLVDHLEASDLMPAQEIAPLSEDVAKAIISTLEGGTTTLSILGEWGVATCGELAGALGRDYELVDDELNEFVVLGILRKQWNGSLVVYSINQ